MPAWVPAPEATLGHICFVRLQQQIAKTGWPDTIHMYPLTVLEARSLKARRQQDGFLLMALRENLFPASLLTWGVCGSPWLVAASLHSVSASVVTWPSQTQGDFALQKLYFHIRLNSQVRMWIRL